MGMLILFRGIQGVGAGALFPVALAIIGDMFTPAERGRYQGLFGAVFGVAFVAGPLIGGWLTENVGWHWIFYVNIPIGIVALAVIQRLLPTVKTKTATPQLRHPRRRDLHGRDGLLLVGLTYKGSSTATGPTKSGPTWVGGLILAGIIGYVLFVLAEARAKEPIVPLDLWKSRAYSASMVSVFFAAFAFFGAIVFLPRWFQVVEGFSPTNSGPRGPAARDRPHQQLDRVGHPGRPHRPLQVAAGRLDRHPGPRHCADDPADQDTPLPIVWLWMFIAGLGVGPTFSVFTIVIQNSVPFRQMGVATSNLTFFRQIGGSVALAFVGTIFAQTLQDDLVPQMAAAGVPPTDIATFLGALGNGTLDFNALTGVGNLAGLITAKVPEVAASVPQIVQGFYGAFSLAVAQTFYLGVIGAVVAVVAALAIKELPLRATNAAPRGREGARGQPRRERRLTSLLSNGPAALRGAGPFDSLRYHRDR